MNSYFEGVIFDCDGVLVDSEVIALEIDHQMLAEIGWPLTKDQIIAAFLGKSDKYFVETVEAELGISLPENWASETTRRYREAFHESLKPVAGIEEALSLILIDKCVASSGTHEKMNFTLGLTGLLDHFDSKLFSSTQVSRGKPHPDLFLFAADQMGWQSSNCVVVEDSDAGVQAALAAGMKVVAYAGGFLDHQGWDNANVKVIDSMLQLPAVVSGQWL